MGTKCISILMRRCKDHIGSHPPSVLICRLSPISELRRYGPEPVLAHPYRLWDSIDTHINASGVDLAVRGPDLFGHIDMLRLCWNCACTSELLYLHRLYTLESPALSFRGARTRKLGGAQRPTPTFLQTAIIRCLDGEYSQWLSTNDNLLRNSPDSQNLMSLRVRGTVFEPIVFDRFRFGVRISTPRSQETITIYNPAFLYIY